MFPSRRVREVALMRIAHCVVCWQQIQARIALCPRCGHTDCIRVRYAIVEIAAYYCAGIFAVGLALWWVTR